MIGKKGFCLQTEEEAEVHTYERDFWVTNDREEKNFPDISELWWVRYADWMRRTATAAVAFHLTHFHATLPLGNSTLSHIPSPNGRDT